MQLVNDDKSSRITRTAKAITIFPRKLTFFVVVTEFFKNYEIFFRTLG